MKIIDKVLASRYALKPLLLLLCLVLMQGCSTRNEKPAPVVENGLELAPPSPVVNVPARDQGTASVRALSKPKVVKLARARPTKAVAGLKQNAQRQRRSGDYSAAVVSLERALRISPRDAGLWNQLAHVRADQRKYAQVKDLAAKSNALAHASERSLKADNWRLIARARHATGDVSGAKAASKQANQFIQ